MKPKPWKKAEELHQAALEREPSERDAFLERACGGDEALLDEVKSLLGNSWIGRRVQSYEVLSLLGAGGMGEVYRAKDTKLGRDVALKVLSEEFARDPERITRFEREARLLAALNHPNVAAIHGLEESEGRHVLVLELVEGETLAERIARGPIPTAEALPLFRQIAAGLEAAHEKGIVHRDLKPSNVTVTPEGQIKVLDFGLAKAFRGVVAAGSDVRTETAWDSQTGEGRIVGTVSYMSPEQARGQAVDKRTDVWAFGCVLYEALTGRRAFAGGTVTDTLAAVLEREVDWNALAGDTPGLVRSLLRRCLQKDRDRRLHDIADARIEIEEAVSEPSSAVAVPGVVEPVRKVHWGYAGLAVAVGVTAAMGVAVWAPWRTTPPAEKPVIRVSIPTGPVALKIDGGPPLALSPDDRQLVYVAERDGTQQLYLREIASPEARPIPGTEGAAQPLFSPDGRWLVFLAEQKLKKVSLSGGPPLPLTDIQYLVRGASWGPDDSIVFGDGATEVIRRISVEGGTPQPLTTHLDPRGQPKHCCPQMPPGGDAVVFVALDESCGNPRIVVQTLATGEQRLLVDGGTAPHLLPTGHIVYAKAATVLAAPFDLERLELTGPSIPLVEGVKMGGCGEAYFSLSANGSLAYLPGGEFLSEHNTLVWVDRQGNEELITAKPKMVGPRLSPDGKRLALWRYGDNQHVWLYEFARDTMTQLTVEQRSAWPHWTPDGQRLTFNSGVPGAIPGEPRDYDLFWRPADGSRRAEELLRKELTQVASSWSPDGTQLVFHSGDRVPGFDIWVLPIEGDREPWPFLATPASEYQGVLSPDGQWLAYVSDETGRAEVYLTSFPRSTRRWTISAEGGTDPVWARGGLELFYLQGQRMMAVEFLAEPEVAPLKPKPLFVGSYVDVTSYGRSYDVAPDGRFIMIKSVEESPPTHVNIIFNWVEELKRRVPAS
jgi:Tol biopolymer transport system component